jgi:hypothetical protein
MSNANILMRDAVDILLRNLVLLYNTSGDTYIKPDNWSILEHLYDTPDGENRPIPYTVS